MRIKKYDYIVNDNGDIWMVEKVHRDGAMTIGHSDGSEITYSAGEIESWFRKLPADVGEKEFDRSGYVDPAPYWGKVEEQTAQFHALQRKGAGTRKTAKRKSGGSRSSSPTGIRGIRG